MPDYRPMDAGFVVPICLHGGPIALASLDDIQQETCIEEQFGLPDGSHSQGLKELGKAYGASGIVAIVGGHVVGLMQFSP